MPVNARRTQSLPSKYMLPSANIGEYESGQRRRSAPARPQGGGLFPLNEEGTYGMPPKGPAPPPKPYPKRERKPKVYSSYAVDSTCDVHAKKLAKVEKQREKEMEEERARRRRNSTASRRSRTYSASPSRGSSEPRSSKSPEPATNGYSMRKKSNEYTRKVTPGPGYSSSSFQTSRQRYSSSTNSSSSFKLRETSFEENDEYEYAENNYSAPRKHSGYSKYANGDLSSNIGTLSLDGLRKPKIDSWDSMGILGLTTKIWNDTKKRQETFMQSTGQFLREETYNSYIM